MLAYALRICHAEKEKPLIPSQTFRSRLRGNSACVVLRHGY